CHLFIFHIHYPITECSTLSLHDALPIWVHYPNFGRGHGKAIASFLDIQNLTLTGSEVEPGATPDQALRAPSRAAWSALMADVARSEEHTSELQSRFDLVCRLLLEKKNKT